MFWYYFILWTAEQQEWEDYDEGWIGKEAVAAANFKALPSKCWRTVSNITEYLSCDGLSPAYSSNLASSVQDLTTNRDGKFEVTVSV